MEQNNKPRREDSEFRIDSEQELQKINDELNAQQAQSKGQTAQPVVTQQINTAQKQTAPKQKQREFEIDNSTPNSSNNLSNSQLFSNQGANTQIYQQTSQTNQQTQINQQALITQQAMITQDQPNPSTQQPNSNQIEMTPQNPVTPPNAHNLENIENLGTQNSQSRQYQQSINVVTSAEVSHSNMSVEERQTLKRQLEQEAAARNSSSVQKVDVQAQQMLKDFNNYENEQAQQQEAERKRKEEQARLYEIEAQRVREAKQQQEAKQLAEMAKAMEAQQKLRQYNEMKEKERLDKEKQAIEDQRIQREYDERQRLAQEKFQQEQDRLQYEAQRQQQQERDQQARQAQQQEQARIAEQAKIAKEQDRLQKEQAKVVRLQEEEAKRKLLEQNLQKQNTGTPGETDTPRPPGDELTLDETDQIHQQILADTDKLQMTMQQFNDFVGDIEDMTTVKERQTRLLDLQSRYLLADVDRLRLRIKPLPQYQATPQVEQQNSSAQNNGMSSSNMFVREHNTNDSFASFQPNVQKGAGEHILLTQGQPTDPQLNKHVDQLRGNFEGQPQVQRQPANLDRQNIVQDGLLIGTHMLRKRDEKLNEKDDSRFDKLSSQTSTNSDKNKRNSKSRVQNSEQNVLNVTNDLNVQQDQQNQQNQQAREDQEKLDNALKQVSAEQYMQHLHYKKTKQAIISLTDKKKFSAELYQYLLQCFQGDEVQQKVPEGFETHSAIKLALQYCRAGLNDPGLPAERRKTLYELAQKLLSIMKKTDNDMSSTDKQLAFRSVQRIYSMVFHYHKFRSIPKSTVNWEKTEIREKMDTFYKKLLAHETLPVNEEFMEILVQYIQQCLYSKTQGVLGSVNVAEQDSDTLISNLIKVFMNGWILCLWCSQIQCGPKAYSAHIERCHSTPQKEEAFRQKFLDTPSMWCIKHHVEGYFNPITGAWYKTPAQVKTSLESCETEDLLAFGFLVQLTPTEYEKTVLSSIETLRLPRVPIENHDVAMRETDSELQEIYANLSEDLHTATLGKNTRPNQPAEQNPIWDYIESFSRKFWTNESKDTLVKIPVANKYESAVLKVKQKLMRQGQSTTAIYEELKYLTQTIDPSIVETFQEHLIAARKMYESTKLRHAIFHVHITTGNDDLLCPVIIRVNLADAVWDVLDIQHSQHRKDLLVKFAASVMRPLEDVFHAIHSVNMSKLYRMTKTKVSSRNAVFIQFYNLLCLTACRTWDVQNTQSLLASNEQLQVNGWIAQIQQGVLQTQVDQIEVFVDHLISSVDDLLSDLYGIADDRTEQQYSKDFVLSGLAGNSPRQHNIIQQDKLRTEQTHFAIIKPSESDPIPAYVEMMSEEELRGMEAAINDAVTREQEVHTNSSDNRQASNGVNNQNQSHDQVQDQSYKPPPQPLRVPTEQEKKKAIEEANVNLIVNLAASYNAKHSTFQLDENDPGLFTQEHIMTIYHVLTKLTKNDVRNKTFESHPIHFCVTEQVLVSLVNSFVKKKQTTIDDSRIKTITTDQIFRFWLIHGNLKSSEETWRIQYGPNGLSVKIVNDAIEKWEEKSKQIHEELKYPPKLTIVTLQHDSTSGAVKPTYCIPSYMHFDFINQYAYICSMRDTHADEFMWIEKFRELGWPHKFVVQHQRWSPKLVPEFKTVNDYKDVIAYTTFMYIMFLAQEGKPLDCSQKTLRVSKKLIHSYVQHVFDSLQEPSIFMMQEGIAAWQKHPHPENRALSISHNPIEHDAKTKTNQF